MCWCVGVCVRSVGECVVCAGVCSVIIPISVWQYCIVLLKLFFLIFLSL